MSKIDKWFIGWHVVYTLLLLALGLLIVIANDCCIGRDPGYWFLGLGALPSAIILGLGIGGRGKLAYTVAIIYGAFIALAMLIIGIIASTFMWAAILFPLFGFIIEAVVLAVRVFKVGR